MPPRDVVPACPVYAAIWVPEQREQVLRLGRTRPQFRADAAELSGLGMRIVDLTSHAFGGSVRTGAVYEAGELPQTLLLGLGADEVPREGVRAFTAYDRGGEARYDVVLEPGAPGRRVRLAMTRDEFAAVCQGAHRVVSLASVSVGGEIRYSALAAPGAHHQLVRLDRPWRRFLAEYVGLKRQGFRLASLSTAVRDGLVRYSAVYDEAGAASADLLTTDEPGDALTATRRAMHGRGFRLAALVTEKVEVLDAGQMARGIHDRLGDLAQGLSASVTVGQVSASAASGACSTDRLGAAGVTNTITAVAVLQLLKLGGLEIDSPIGPLLPAGWARGPHIEAVTFRQLLTHTSGLRGGGSTFGELRSHVERGVAPHDRTFAYRHENYALLRTLIPRLDGFDDAAFSDCDADIDRALTACYLSYLNRAVFAPIGIAAGTTLSTEDLAAFLVALRETDVLLDEHQRERMIALDLGWQGRSPVRHGHVSEHGGATALIASFSAGVQAAVLVDAPSAGANLRQATLDAYRSAWLPI